MIVIFIISYIISFIFVAKNISEHDDNNAALFDLIFGPILFAAIIGSIIAFILGSMGIIE